MLDAELGRPQHPDVLFSALLQGGNAPEEGEYALANMTWDAVGGTLGRRTC